VRLLQVENIRVPLIMAHGKNDVVVNPGESERMFQVSYSNNIVFFSSILDNIVLCCSVKK
jgi:hypothetical protein